MGGLCLANAGNIVFFAFNRHQRHFADRTKIDLHIPMHHLAFGQSMLHKHSLDRLQIELCGQIHDSEIFIVKFPMLFG